MNVNGGNTFLRLKTMITILLRPAHALTAFDSLHEVMSFIHTADQPCMDGGGCSHICANVEGEEKCFCPLGLELSTPGGTQCIGMFPM